jgi:hypothetical protein
MESFLSVKIVKCLRIEIKHGGSVHEGQGNGFKARLCVTNTLQSQLCEKSIFQNDRNTAVSSTNFQE